MSKRKKSNPNSKALVVMILLGAGVVGMLAAYVKFGGGDQGPTRQNPAYTALQGSGETQPAAKTYYVFAPGSGEKSPVTVTDGQDPVKAVTDAYAKAAYSDGKVRCLSVDVKDKVAAVNFTKGFATEAGSFEEGEIIDGLMKTLGQFEAIDKAQILVEGETLETGHNVYDEVEVIRG